jgi:hypothetical protein
MGTSVDQVERGVLLVDRAGATIRVVVTSVDRVSGIVRYISEASREQSTGVSQVGDAVSQMDVATQQNAALVEESAAAAASLNEQAQRLVQAVSVFRLAEQARPQATRVGVRPSPAVGVAGAVQARKPVLARPALNAPRAQAASSPSTSVTAAPTAATEEWESF